MGRNLLTALVIFMSIWLVATVCAQSAIPLDLEPLPTTAVSQAENLADWQKGLEILQGVTLKERGAEFDYDCKGRWDSDQVCKYIWAAYEAQKKKRYGRSLKFSAAGLALNPRVRQLLDRVGGLLIEHCTEALPYMERGVGPDDSNLTDLTHCRGAMASSPNEVRRARRLFWVSAHLIPPPDWERQRIAATYFDALEFGAGDSLAATDLTWQEAFLRDKAWARRRPLESLTHSAKFSVAYLEEDHMSPLSSMRLINLLNTFPGLPHSEIEAVILAGESAKSHGGMTWTTPVATVRNFFEIQADSTVQPVDDLWTFGSLGLRMAFVTQKERPSRFEEAPVRTRFAWLLANGELTEAWPLLSKLDGAVEQMGFLTLNCLHVSSFDRSIMSSNLDLTRETTWKALWSELCARRVNYTAHWIEHPELKASAMLMAAIVQLDEPAMRELAAQLKDSDFMQAQVARLWAGAVLGDVGIFESAKKTTTEQAALKWFDLLAKTVFLAKTQGGEKAKAHFESLPPYVRSAQPESAEAAAYVFVASRACAQVDPAFAGDLNKLYFENSALGRKLSAIIKKQEGK